jgi:hypothetical protein
VGKNFLKEVACHYCKNIFLATRSDAKRCSECRKNWLVEYRKKPENKSRRSLQNRQLREKLFAGYGGKCVCCGESKFEFLALDHVAGGGRKERSKLSTQQISSRAVKNNFPPKYRVLCHNCNQAIGWYGKCPHKQEQPDGVEN